MKRRLKETEDGEERRSFMPKMVVKPEMKWFEQLPDDPVSNSVPDPQLVASLRKEAECLYKEDILQYQKFLQKRKEKSDFSWMKTILQSGTLSDKISAHTLLIQDSAVHNVSSIESLISMVTPKGKRECLMAMESLKDLFLSDLLRRNKKLKSFPQQPLEDVDKLTSNNIMARKKRLLLWYFEDKVKELYLKFLKNVEIVSRDTVEKTKQKSVTVMYALLKDNPEQEQFLLEHLVNKIGDPIAKVGSHVCYLLGQLVENHPNMIAIVVQEVERLVFRQNVSERARYYCVCFFSQLILSHELYNIANHLITMYFALFKMCVKKGEVNTKMMSVLLTGVSRAYPYSKLKNNVIMEQLDSMFRLVHMVNFNISIQALMLIFQVLDSKDSVSDRFYCALYRKIVDPDMGTSTRQSLLLNLLYKALKKDAASVRVKAFVKRLVQVALYQSPNLQCGILMLISELAKTHQNLLEAPASVVQYSEDSDSEEHFDDVPEGDSAVKEATDVKMKPSSSWVHKSVKGKRSGSSHGYDPQNRNPLHAGSEYSHLWELRLLKSSFHPSVSLFAHQVSHSKDVLYNGDPLADFTLIRFLDRFVYRNPKKLPENAKASAHRKVFGRRIGSQAELQLPPINSSNYVQQSEEKIPVDERFIYKYLLQRAKSGKVGKKDDSDVDSVGSDEFEDLLDSMHREDEGKKSFDFAKELSSQKPKSESKDNGSSDSDLGSLDDDSDFEGELNFEDDEEFKNAFNEYDEDIKKLKLSSSGLIEDDIDEEEFEELESRQKRKYGKRRRKSSDIVFASADEFATLIEDNAGSRMDTMSSEAFVNSDKSAAKQLAWEKQRDQYVRGTDWKSRKNRTGNKFPSRKRKPQGKKCI